MKKLRLWICIAVPLLLAGTVLLRTDAAVSPLENRTLQTRDTLPHSIADGALQRGLEAWLSDQFPLRMQLKQAETDLRLCLGAEQLGGAYIGADGRLFQQYTQAQIDPAACVRYAREVDRLAQTTGLPACVLYVPSAEIALRPLLPAGAPVYDYDALFAACRQALPHAAVPALLPVLSGDAGNYYQTDHHWTAQGAFRAYGLWRAAHGQPAPAMPALSAAAERFHGSLFARVPGRTIPYDRLEIPEVPAGVTAEADGQPIDFYDRAAAASAAPYDVFQGGNHGVLTVKNPACAGGKTLLLLKDSFANSLLPYLINDYACIVAVDERYAFLDPAQLAKTVGADEIGVVRELVSVP